MQSSVKAVKPWTSRGFGRRIEAQAAKFLSGRGLKLLHRNYCCRAGEIDLILENPAGTLVFAEVRFRRSQSYGGAAASVTFAKQRRIKLAAAQFLLHYPRYQQKDCRFDVLAVHQSDRGDPYSFEWIPHAFV